MSACARTDVLGSSSSDNGEPQHTETPTATSQDLELIWKWNESVPEAVEGRVHDLISNMAQLQPDAQAVCAWDGNWSYRQLDELSTNLAYRLVSMGIGPDVVVPLCFQKSKWTPIAKLAVMKAGGASVALELSLPHDRLRSIVQQVEPILILSSSADAELAGRLITRPVIIVDEARTTLDVACELPEVQPWNTLYVIFTSGSTGTPKGTVLTHSNFCTSIYYQRDILGYTTSSRVYDFAKYSFDVTWSNFIHTMTAGGCLCIPSQEEVLNNLVGSIRSYNANSINITPSVGTMMRPSDLSGILKHVTFAGEALASHLASQWAQHVCVINLYGPAECTVGATLAVIDGTFDMKSVTATIGRGFGMCTWVVDPFCHDRLVPVGAVGELILEGPIMGAGYIGNPEKQAAVFIESAKWLLAGPPGRPGRSGRLYKTGDLVRYEPNGQLTYLGRKDLQVKINGQRVELGDIEYHVRTHAADNADVQVAAELVTPSDSDRPLLVAFLQISTPAAKMGIEELEAELRRVIDGLNDRLAAHLPAYMIPSAYIPLVVFPKTASGKMDRRKLKEICAGSLLQELMARGQPLPEKREPTTLMELRLQSLWSSILGLDAGSIGAEDSFLRLGGDSIGAMKLVGAARERGLSLSVADIFNHPVLFEMAGVATEVSEAESFIKPFALLKENIDVVSLQSQAAGACGVDTADIQDIFPCTPLQEGLIALTAKHPGDYVSRHVFQLQPTVEMSRLEKAWEQVVATTPILRTRIIDGNQQGLVQVVINQPTAWASKMGGINLAEYKQADEKLTTGLGTPLVRFALLEESTGEEEVRRFFVWTIHHALYDGWSKPLLLERLAKAYAGEGMLDSSPQFQSFVGHILDMKEDEASKFWSTQFEDFEAQNFPALPSPRYEPRSDKLTTHTIGELQWPKKMGVTASTTLRAAWSIITSCYTDTNDTVFGVTVSGRQATVGGVDQMTGPTLATVPVRIVLDKSKTVEELLVQIQTQVVDMTAFEQTGLQRIQRVSSEAKRACDFQTLLVIQPAADEREKAVHDGLFKPLNSEGANWTEMDDEMAEFRTYPLSLECHLQDQGVVLSTRFDSAVLNDDQVAIILRQLEHVVRQLCDAESASKRVEDLALVSYEDLQQIWHWNSKVPETADGVVHDLIATMTRRQPEAQAICAWDGNWTYHELDELSTRLAHDLVELGVKPGVIVPLCIEKSRWMPVAMMAVMKAGGASVAMDYAQPEDRLRSIAQQVSPIAILTSAGNRDLAGRIVEASPAVVAVVVVDDVVDEQIKKSTLGPSVSLPVVDQSDTLYLVFTSGSTGTPKGVVVTHANITSAIRHQRGTLAFTRESRIYDFSSYMFDVVWCNLLQGLSAGGCICIPSNDNRRNDPLGAIAGLDANTAIFTPSTIRGLDLQLLKNIRHILFIGEALTVDDVGGLHPDTVVTNLYGPTECTTFSTAQQVIVQRASDKRIKRVPIGIGAGLGLRTWLVQPLDHSKLVSLGCVGELLLEGPLVATGYLGEEKKTAAAFTNDPAWLLDGIAGREGRHGRLYKTGDLARYNTDGTLTFLGRKDSQVKINGQRVELGDIEHHVLSNILHSQNVNVIAEVVKPRDSSNAILVAFIKVSIASLPGDETALQDELATITTGLTDRLLTQVPAYMIPSAYIPLREIPVTPTGKIDRLKLRSMGQELTFEELVGTNLSSSYEQVQPSTAIEKSLQSLWGAVLGVKPENIGANDSFLRIGGDSIAAMRLVAAARGKNMALSVADVFQHPVLSDLATVVVETTVGARSESSHHIEPFALLNPSEGLKTLKEQIANKCNVAAWQVNDAFPCTPLQEGLLALTAKRPGDYVARFIYPLQQNVGTGQFSKAWEAVVSATPILRTRIVDLGERGLVQAVVNEPTSWSCKDELMSLEAYELADRQLTTGLGTPMVRFATVQDPVDDSRYFVWTMHHALYDGWSISLMLDKLEAAYNLSEGDTIPSSPPLQTFVKHVMGANQNIAATYWKEQFQDSEAQIFPSIPSAIYQPISNAFIKHRVHDLHWPKTDVTPSMIIRAAWSILAAKYTDSTDTVFGITVSGRQASVLDVEQMVGPTIATVPVRVTLDLTEMTVEALLHQVQTQAVEMTAFEQTGLQRIRRVNAEAERACGFQTLLVVHPVEDAGDDNTSSRWFISRRDENGEDDTNVTEHDTHALTLEFSLERQGLRLRIAYDANILGAEQVERLAAQLEHVIRQLCMPGNASKSLSSIDFISTQDMRDIWEWNSYCPEPLNACLHHLISETARRLPDALAVNAWDGDFSYSELDEISTRLAHHLSTVGVGPETIIPLYFEKSKWTPIAMLAVMKAGGASVMMDSRQPQDRLQAIINQIQPIAVVTSSSNEKLASKLTNTPTIVVNYERLAEMRNPEPLQPLPQVHPWNKAYLIFTSGSTGTPKGAIMTHENVCSAVRYQQLAQGYTPDARVYDFTSYAFDTTWNNFMHTFTIGACLCIPSEDERRDDLAGSIERFKPSILDITPSAATALQHNTIQSLRTLILGGERLSPEYARRWGALVDLKVCYGPCECTPTATVSTVDPRINGEPSIGRGIGMVSWIADSKNSDILVPVGAIGELILEGPLIGQGYLGDETKTNAVFVNNSRWLLHGGAGRPGRKGRLYKTGDLVRYNSNGTLEFVGRKDAQVKINGQRVELGEVENHMARHHRTRQSASLYPRSGRCAKKLVGVFSLEGIYPTENSPDIEVVGNENATAVQEHIQALQSLLGEALPSYMIPSVWVALKNIPLNPAGKLNRRLVEDWLFSIDSDTFARINNTGLAPSVREPESDAERIICEACSVILNMPSAEINLQCSFITNGGDSISAMRLSSYCRAANLIFSVSVLLKSKRLADVAQLSTLVSAPAINRDKDYDEDFGKPFALSPIQKWFFAQSPSHTVTQKDFYCNQGFYVKINRHISTETISQAIGKIVGRHSMLRARFEQSETGWMQSIPKPGDAVYHFGSADAQSICEIKATAAGSHQSLDIQRGLVFVADIYTLPNGDQYLILIAHHLVVDLVSWRIILDDLEAVLIGKKLLDGIPFQLWNKLQADEAQSSRFAPDKVLSSKNVHNNHQFWNFTEHTPNTTKDHVEKNIEVDTATTLLLLKGANIAFNTEPVDLILASIWDAFLRVFPTRDGLTIFNEGHGREPWTTNVDLSRTVGWFTTISPIHVSRSDGNSAANIARLVKDARRRLPSNGWAYWVSRHLNRQGIAAFESHASTMEVQFNYHGQFQQLERSDSLFDVVNFDDSVSAVGPSLPTSVLFDINAVIEAGVTKLSFSWNRHIAHQDLIQEWVAQINPSLQSVCSELTNKRPERTLCDYEFLDLDYKGLDELHENSLSHIERLNNAQVSSVYPSSPMVDGILLSQMKGTGSYETSQTWEIRPRQSHRINTDALINAWQSVVARHPSLRTVFIHSMDASVAFNSVILESYRGDVLLVESDSFESAILKFKELPQVNYVLEKPAHRLVLCTILGDDRVVCKIEMSHAISDGASTAITMQDWAKAYSGELDVEELNDTSDGFARILSSVSKADKMAYWGKKLSAMEPCHFPRLAKTVPAANEHSVGVTTLELGNEVVQRIQRFCETQSVTPASLFQSAWALTLSAYTASDSVCFGYLASGRDFPIKGIMDSIGAFANVMICRTDISREWSGKDLINHVHDQVLQDLSFQHCSIADIQHELGLVFGQNLFNSIISFQKDEDGLTEGMETQDLVFTDVEWEDPTEYDITISIRHTDSAVYFTVDYRLACVSDIQARSIVSLLENVVTSLISDDRADSTNQLSLIDSISEKDMQDIWEWNKTVPEAVNALVHEIIADVARRTPDAPAVCAWDGDFTYTELNTLATKLAYHLVTLGIGPEVIVPLYFEKSKWMPVAMLAVMKAGAASVALDSTLPEERLRSIIQQINPTVILTSSANEEKTTCLTDCIAVPVSEGHFAELDMTSSSLPEVKPFNKLYIVFTSGSTGVPKGVIITHANFSSAIRYQQAALGFKSTSRVYDFVKYAFDVTWSNFLHTMTAGACLCIPSETETSNNITSSLISYGANFADLTPSVASTLRPADLTTLDHLLFSGEALTTDLAVQWAEKATVLNTYGPAECSVKATFAVVGNADASAASIGPGFGMCTWIVLPNDQNKLVPIGVPGELLLEGPLVGLGYLNDPAKSNAAFIEDPTWLVRGASTHVGRRGRLYKTGDIVRYNGDGSMTFVGRKDAQVKINGQRLELGDVEHHVRTNIVHEAQVQVFAEVIKPQGSSKSMLLAFVHVGEELTTTPSSRNEQTSKITAGLNERLASKVPGYMIPSAYLLLDESPMTATGKTDRRRLREMGQELTFEEVVELNSRSGEYKSPSTTMEKRIRGLWASVLGIGENSISVTDSFLRIGGDSIGAMKLVGTAREQGLALTVTHIFQHPKLSDLARMVGLISKADSEDIQPFFLLRSGIDPLTARDQVAKLCKIDGSQIEDVFPCTPLQEGLLALTAKRPGDYVAQYVMPLQNTIDVARFKRAWEHVLQMTPILRTRIVDLLGQGLVQVVLKGQVCWSHCSSVAEYQQADKKVVMGMGTPLVRYAVTDVPDDKQRMVFAWTVHHALYDGWSMPRIMDRLELAYRAEATLQQAPPFQRFVKHIISIDDERAKQFWQGQFEGSEAQVFPTLPSPTYQPTSNTFINHYIADLHWPKTDITASSIIRAAWCILTARYTNSNDVVFGVTLNGRQAAVHEVDEMTGPTLATVPVRVAFDWEQTVEQCLQQIQEQLVGMTAFEQTGLQKIRQMGINAKQACDFQTLLLIHPPEEVAQSTSHLFASKSQGGDEDEEEAQLSQFDTHALTIECDLAQSGLNIRLEFDTNILSQRQVAKLGGQIEHVLRLLCDPAQGTKQLTDIETVSKEDLKDIWGWNATVPETVETPVHEIITAVAQKQPEAPAICAWDGDFSYGQLHDLSSRLAHYLMHLGVGPEVIIPLCFEKSKWAPVAIFGVMKAGGVCVTVDPSLPEDRLNSIVQQVKPTLVLSSQVNKNLATQLSAGKPVVVIEETLFRTLEMPAFDALPKVQPSNTLYIVFTSGSTGIPKGVRITHSNFSSSMLHQHSAHNFDSKTHARVYDFASYAFDTSWQNMLAAFDCGACLCIPSEAERRDDLAGSIERFGITHSELTPSAAMVLPLSTLKTLDTLILGGERLQEEYARRWASLVNVKNSYGPCECTPTSTVADVDPVNFNGASIGRGRGVNTWIVDTTTGNSLVPVGGIGELMLEGPLVGPGYLGDPEKTASVFIHNPPWLTRGAPGHSGREGRLYKTGDLVSYHEDGTLTFVGRKDAQVKIHGQRVELGDIENHILRHHLTRQSACLLPKSGPWANTLVSVFSVQNIQHGLDEVGAALDLRSSSPTWVSSSASSDTDFTTPLSSIGDSRTLASPPSTEIVLEDATTTIQSYIEIILGILESSLPSYMVPTKWIALKEIPLNPSGKLNRKQVNTWLTEMDQETYAKLSSMDNSSVCREPESEAERVLRDACSLVLNIPASEVNIQRSFIANGGDSISAMRLSPHCRAGNVVFSVATLLKAKSLAKVAELSSAATSSVLSRTEDFDKPFPLSPIQQWFFDQTPQHLVSTTNYYCNQSFYVKINQRVLAKEVRAAVAKVVGQHSMLRARFQQQGNVWTQSIPQITEAVYHFDTLKLESINEIQSLAIQRQESLNFERGLVFSADLCELAVGGQYLVLIAHHLVIDLVSWRIILEDLETLLTGGSLMEGLPFQIWNSLQHQEAKNSKFDPEHVLSTKGVTNDLAFWNFKSETPNATHDQICKTFVIDQQITSLALKEANNAFNTETVDLLLSAVWDAFFKTFPSRNGLTVFNEGHGREPWNAEIDLYRTVGWFTTMSPIHLSRRAGIDQVNIVRLVKDARRKLPANGWAYFTSRYLNEKGVQAFGSHDSVMEITFNYHGQFQQLERDESFFDSIALDNVSDVGPNLPASSLFNINMSIEGGQTHVSFAWNHHISNQNLISKWVDQIGPSLQSICENLVSRCSERTLIDYEFLNLDYTGLDDLQRRVIPEIEKLNRAEVEDIYPCSPMVEGILLSQLKGVGFYETSQFYEIKSRGSHVSNIERLSAAWQDVIVRHPSLRSIFIESLDSSMAFNQVVLKGHHGDVVLLESDNLDSARVLLETLPKVNYQQLKPPHRLALCRVLDTNSILCQIEMNHTITDGASTGILIEDWAKAYKGVLARDSLIETSRGFARALTSSNSESKKAYWKSKLAGLQPCLFPHLEKISEPSQVVSWSAVDIDGAAFTSLQKFCETHSITPASLFHAAWALTLASYTSTDSVCFGYVASGRDFPVPGIGEAIGAYANMMICRADISREWNKHRFVQYLHHQVLEDMGYQHCSLADIQHDLGIASGQQLFNTIMSFQKDIDDDPIEASDTRQLDFIDADGDDPTEYDVAISITFGTKLARLFINCLPSRYSNEQAHRIVSLFKTVVIGLVSDDTLQSDENTLRSINTICDEELQEIWQWNSAVPEAADTCLHDLISATAQRQPEADAIHAWDGDLTYGELEHNATRLAYHLVSLGIGPDAIVALYLEKSRWTAVGMLAVMKAGGVSVMMDSSQPESLLRTMADQSKPALLIAYTSTKQLAGKLTDGPLLVLNDALFEILTAATSVALPSIQPSNKACLVFSSEGPGPSNPAILTHANLTSVVTYQQTAQGYKPDSRIYDFMPYSSGIAWKSFTHVFTSGGCLCVPSESEHRDNIANSISRWQPTILDITPSTAAILDDSIIQSLQTLILNGERLSTEKARQWAPLVDLKLTYGTYECTPIATVDTVCLEEADEHRIGRGVGTNTWITDTRDGTTLLPIGSIGELVLEGPLVGAGYLDDAEKTAASLIYNPPWLIRGSGDPNHPGRTGQLFKTGDLVRYNKDGTLIFIARKEAQVKIFGQHVDLAEVENHMSGVSSIRQAACLLPKSGHYVDKLVGVFSLDGIYGNDSDDENTAPHLISRDRAEEVQDSIQSLQAVLDNSVPAYMVPVVFVALENVPVDHSGKLNRKMVANWLSNLDEETYTRISNAGLSSCGPVTATERVIRDACSHILNIPANNINMQRSFIANGGDSISAMRTSPYCRAAGVIVSVASLLRSKCLVDVAESATVAKGPALSHEEDFDKPFSLSPIQQWFFAQSPADKVNTTSYYCNQAFYVQIKRQVLPEEVSIAIRKIVQKHSMLRARFRLHETMNKWTQLVPNPNDALYHFASLQVDSLTAVKSIIAQRHEELDIERGLVFSADIFTLGTGEQYLSLIAHHLVVDLVSWRIILDDLESLLNGGAMLDVLPFQTWQNLQKTEAHSHNYSPERVLCTETDNNLEFWNYTSSTPNTFDDHTEASFEVDHATTAILLKAANKAFNTEPVDLILASVWDAFFTTFEARDGLTIFNEGHGREPWSAEIDLSRTVGWFTTMTPMHVSRDNGGKNIARAIKDSRRQLPSNGWAYFTSRYLNDKGVKAFESHDCVMEVLFNYHGQFQQLESDDSLFENVTFDEIFDVGSDLPTSALFSINVAIEGGLTKFTFSWNRYISHQSLIRDWIAQVAPSMKALCSSLSAAEPSLTISDFEFLSLDYKGLDELQDRILPALQSETGTNITDIYPCSPMVDGMLLSQIREPEAYKTVLMYEMRHNGSQQPLDINTLAKAWQAVIARHPALRSVFIEGVDKKTAFAQAVLETYQGEVIVLETQNKTAAVAMIEQLPAVDYQQLKPAHRLVLCRATDNDVIICQVEMNHAIVDGASTSIMLNDWSKAYSGTLGTENFLETNRNFVRALRSSPLADKMTHWKNKLAGLEPCHFPRLSEASTPKNGIAMVSADLDGDDFTSIQRFCESQSVTPASIFQSAWALLLSTYTNNNSVCFGYIASGRDLPIDGIEDSINAYANMMVCRADVSRSLAPRLFVQQLHDQVLGDLDFQHCSLADIQHDLQLSPGYPLFNTIVSFQKDDADAADVVEIGEISFIDMDHEDPTEVSPHHTRINKTPENIFSSYHTVRHILRY